MKRSEINSFAARSLELLGQHLALPPWAFWSVDEWERIPASAASELLEGMCGLDITDFGSGAFGEQGLFLVTAINGGPGPASRPPYCHKLMLSLEGQVCPRHTHHAKSEHIIVEHGVLELVLSRAERSDAPMEVSINGITRQVAPDVPFTLTKGEAIRLEPGQFHVFQGASGPYTLLREVSTVNDDTEDNLFDPPLPRFPGIQNDVAGVLPLCTDLQEYFQTGVWPWQEK
jgi:hypothetical protein